MARVHAEDAARRATIPSRPDEYPARLPDDLKVPDGVEFQVVDDDPTLKMGREFAHKHGLSTAQFQELFGIYAGNQIQEAVQISHAREAEVQKLGATGPARIDAISLKLSAMLGPTKGAALLDRLVLASDVEAMEDLLRDRNPSYSQSHRDGRDHGPSEEEWSAMTMSERADHWISGAQPSGGR